MNIVTIIPDIGPNSGIDRVTFDVFATTTGILFFILTRDIFWRIQNCLI
jgi:hypothetical protein